MTIKFCILKVVWLPNFILNWQFWFFGLNLPKKSTSGCKQKRSKHNHWLLQTWINLSTRFQLKRTILNVGDQICLKKVFPVTNKRVFPVIDWKSEHHHWILHNRINLATKFHQKMTVFMFWTKFTQKGYFRLKMVKMVITIEFWIFEQPSFSTNWQVRFFVSNLLKVGVSGRNKSEHHHCILLIRISVSTKFCLKFTIFSFSTKFAQSISGRK